MLHQIKRSPNTQSETEIKQMAYMLIQSVH